MRIFLSWYHQDARDKDALLRDLVPALGLFAGLAVEWWDDSQLTSGEEFGSTIVSRIDSDYGLLLLSTRCFSRPFIRKHELPRFAGPEPDKGSLPVALSPLPPLDDTRDLGGVQPQLVFARSYPLGALNRLVPRRQPPRHRARLQRRRGRSAHRLPPETFGPSRR